MDRINRIYRIRTSQPQMFLIFVRINPVNLVNPVYFEFLAKEKK